MIKISRQYNRRDIMNNPYIDDLQLLVAMLLMLHDFKVIERLPTASIMNLSIAKWDAHQSYMKVHIDDV